MKILVAHKYLFHAAGGTATYLLALRKELERRGHEFIPLTVAYSQAEDIGYSKYYVSPPLGPDEPRLRDMRLTLKNCVRLFVRATYSLEAKRKAGMLVDAAYPDVAYVNNIYNYMSPSIIHAFRKRSLPVVMRVSDCNLFCASFLSLRGTESCMECAERGLWRAVRHRCVKGRLVPTLGRVASMYVHRFLKIYDGIDLFVAPSQYMADQLARARLPNEKIRHLPSFAPPTGAITDGTYDGSYIMYSGRITPEKGIDLLLDAYAKIGPKQELVIAGGDREGELARLQQRAAHLDLQTVHFVGHKEKSELYRLLAGCSFVVVPSRCPDNSPMSVLESFAHGKPVIGARTGGIPEQIQNGVGMLFEPGNTEDLAERMRLLLENASVRREMGRAALHRAQTVYSLETHCERLLELFSAVCASAGVGKGAEA